MTLHELNQLRYLRQELPADRRRLTALVRKCPDNPAETAEICGRIAERMKRCAVEIVRLEAYITAIDDSLTRQAFVLRFSDGLSWRAVAYRIGGGNTVGSVKMLVRRYLKQHP